MGGGKKRKESKSFWCWPFLSLWVNFSECIYKTKREIILLTKNTVQLKIDIYCIKKIKWKKKCYQKCFSLIYLHIRRGAEKFWPKCSFIKIKFIYCFKPVELLDRVENFSAPPQLFIMLVMECAVVELFWSLFIYNLHTNIVYGDIFQCSLFLSLYIQIAKLESRHFFFYLI